MTNEHRFHLLSTAAAVLTDTAHLLAADLADRDVRERTLDAPGLAFYATRIRIVRRAHEVAGRVTGALLAGESPELRDALAVAHHAALFDHWFGRRPAPAAGPLHPADA